MFARTILFISASLGIGYWVLIKANQEKVTKGIGKAIAWVCFAVLLIIPSKGFTVDAIPECTAVWV